MHKHNHPNIYIDHFDPSTGFLTPEDLYSYLNADEIQPKISVSPKVMKQVKNSYDFLSKFSKDKVIYGINTGFGPMAQYRVSDNELEDLQYNLIRSHAVGAGEHLPVPIVRGAMVIRLLTFCRGYSGVHTSLIDTILAFLNNDITPFVPIHGGVGASGDLVQLSHIALALIGEGYVFHAGELRPTDVVLKELDLNPFKIRLREGLALINGTAVMTSIGISNFFKIYPIVSSAMITSALLNEIAGSYNDFLAPKVHELKGHFGQHQVSQSMREILSTSKRMKKREKELYRSTKEEHFDEKVQPFYSLRCVPQIIGPIFDELDNIHGVLSSEMNAVDDNPIVDREAKNVYHAGNFHGDYVSLAMDKLKIVLTKLTMLFERQINYLMNDKVNGILPPFLNLGKLGLNYGMQAMQFTATSTTAENQTLSFPNYLHSIPCNNDNQDIVSMGTNSAMIAQKVVENTIEVFAILWMALAQAVDALEIADELSNTTREFYELLRTNVPKFTEDAPKFVDIAIVVNMLQTLSIGE